MSSHDTPIDELAHLKSLLEQGETRAVVKACERRLAVNERDAASWYLLGQAHRQADNYETAVTALRRACALEANPGYALAYGIALQLDGQLDAAADILEQSASRWDRHPQLRNSLGLTYRKLARYGAARKEYSAAIQWHVYHIIRNNQSSYLRPEPCPDDDGAPLWARVYAECALLITTEDGIDAYGSAEDYISDADAPARGLFWLDDTDERGQVRRLWLVDGLSALYWLLRGDRFYATCLGNLATVVSLMGEEALADAYMREAEAFNRSSNE